VPRDVRVDAVVRVVSKSEIGDAHVAVHPCAGVVVLALAGSSAGSCVTADLV